MTELQPIEQQVALRQPGTIQTPSGAVDCEILTLARSGALVRPLGDLGDAEELFLAVRGFGQLACKAVDSDGDCLELAFCGDPESQDAVFQDILERFGDEEGRRRFLRRSVLWPGQLSTEGRLLDCTVLNMSLGGAKVALSEEIDLSGAVTLSGDRFEGLQAKVVWQRGRVLGLQFSQNPAQIANVLGSLLPAIKASA